MIGDEPVTTTAKVPVAQTLLDKVAVPALFLAMGWAFGFMHGRSSKKSA